MILLMSMAAAITGAGGLLQHLGEACEAFECKTIVPYNGERASPLQEGHEEVLKEFNQANRKAVVDGGAPQIACVNHTRDPHGCSPARWDIRFASQRAIPIVFTVAVDMDDALTPVLDGAGIDALSIPGETVTLTDTEELVLPAARNHVDVWAAVHHIETATSQTFPIEGALGVEAPVDRGTGIHEWAFDEQVLLAQRTSGDYVITFVANGTTGRSESAAVIVTVVDHPPPQLHVPGGTPRVAEGETATFFVELLGDPGGRTVTWDVASQSNRLSVSPTRVTLDSMGAPGRVPIEVTAADDEIALGDEMVTITYTFRPTLSTWTEWGLDNLNTRILLHDEDKARIDVDVPNGTLYVREGAGSATASARLTSQPQGDVYVALELDEAGGVVVPDNLVFGPGNWSETQEFLVRFSPDGSPGNVRNPSLVVRPVPPSSSDYRFTLAQQVQLNVIDADTVLLRHSLPVPELQMSEHEPGRQIRISPAFRPEGLVIVEVETMDPTVVAPVPSRLTFTPANWSQGQTVFLSVVPDDAPLGDRTGLVKFNIGQDSAASYRDTKALEITVGILDNDFPVPAGAAEVTKQPVLHAPLSLDASLLGQQVSLSWEVHPSLETPAYAVWRYPGGIVKILPASGSNTETYAEMMPGAAHRYAVQAVPANTQPRFDDALTTEWAFVMRAEAVDEICRGKIDTDRDRLCDEFELILRTSPTNADTDGDGVSDHDELMLAKTDPLNPASMPLHSLRPNSHLSDARIYALSSAALLVLVAAAVLVVLVVRRPRVAGSDEAKRIQAHARRGQPSVDPEQ